MKNSDQQNMLAASIAYRLYSKLLIEFQWDYYSQLCLEITRDSPSLLHHWQVAEDFVCGIFEEREDEETYSRLLRSSIRDEVVEQLGILQDG